MIAIKYNSKKAMLGSILKLLPKTSNIFACIIIYTIAVIDDEK